jgi:hypothetical protein
METKKMESYKPLEQEFVKTESKTLEEKAEQTNQAQMSFFWIFKSMIPSIIVGTAAAAGCQEICSRYTENPETITLAGMVGQYLGAYSAFFPSYLYTNRERLIKGGKIRWRPYFQEIGAVIASDRIGNKVWAGSYGLANEVSLRAGLDPAYSGLVSGVFSGLSYNVFTSAFAPKVNSFIDLIKRKFKGNKIY